MLRLAVATFAVTVLGSACEQPKATPASTSAPASVNPPADAAPPAKPVESLPKSGDLHYVEVLLGGAQPDETLPMIVAIHGLGDAPQNFAHIFATFPEPARLILPRGLDAFEPDGGWSWFPKRARDPDVEGVSAGIKAAADTIAAALPILLRERKTLGKPIVTGFSQGGMLTLALAVHHPQVVGAAVPIGGWLPPPLWPPHKVPGTRYPPILALHGTADSAVRFEPTAASLAHLQQLGFSATLKQYEGVGHALTPEILRDMHDRVGDAIREAGSE